MRNTLNKTELKALGKVFMAEVTDRLPFQSRAIIYRELGNMGLLKFDKEKRGAVTIEGWYLTTRGREYFCWASAKAGG